MIAFDRKKQILALLQQKKALKVDQLAKALHTSPATVRRDLHQLSQEGLLRRIRGGAAFLESNMADLPFDFRKVHSSEKKRDIAKRAADFLENDQRIFIDSSTTVLPLIPYLKEFKGLHVLTNGILTAHLISQNTDAHVTMVGGHVHKKSSSINGATAATFVSGYRADIAFMSAKSLTPQGAMEFTEEEAAIRKAFVSGAKEKVLLLDSTKFTNSCFFLSISMDELDCILTDEPLPEDIRKSALRNGVECISLVSP